MKIALVHKRLDLKGGTERDLYQTAKGLRDAGMSYPLKALFWSLFVRQQGRPSLSVPKKEDLLLLKELCKSGKVTPVIDRTYPLGETPEAMAYVGEGHARSVANTSARRLETRR